MKNDKNILSIVIPTYKRVKFLETTVTCVALQIKKSGLEELIEVIISDDASKDETASYVNHVHEDYSFVQGFVQPKNLGVSQNIEWLIQKAGGPYILICCDDDMFADGALEYLIHSIQEKNPNLILINTSNIMSLDDANKKYKIVLQNRLNITQDIFIENFEKEKEKLLLTNNWLHMVNLATAVVFKKDIFNKELLAAKDFLRPENVYLFQAPLLVGISKYGRLLLIGQPLVLHRKNETNWTKNVPLEFFIDIHDPAEVAKLLKQYMPSEYTNYRKHWAALIMGSLLSKTQNGMNVRKFAWDAFRAYLTCFPENIQFLGMAIVPKFITHSTPALRRLKTSFKK